MRVLEREWVGLGILCQKLNVARFVDRYIPGYVFFGDGPTVGFGSQKPRWIGKSLRIRIDDDRAVVGTEKI
jgi:D-glycerate 3-kinase